MINMSMLTIIYITTNEAHWRCVYGWGWGMNVWTLEVVHGEGKAL